jgi:hypothetical protein
MFDEKKYKKSIFLDSSFIMQITIMLDMFLTILMFNHDYPAIVMLPIIVVVHIIFGILQVIAIDITYDLK